MLCGFVIPLTSGQTRSAQIYSLTPNNDYTGFSMTEAVFTFTTSSPDETQAWGREFSSQLERGDCIALIGELGSGKTCLTQGICEGLRVTDRVNSPTFILVNEYTGEHDDGKALVVYHFDLYRLGGEEELADLGWDDYLDGEGICVVEWADRARGLIPNDAIEIRIEAPDKDVRSFTIYRGERNS